jgi:hypothetical protein
MSGVSHEAVQQFKAGLGNSSGHEEPAELYAGVGWV